LALKNSGILSDREIGIFEDTTMSRDRSISVFLMTGFTGLSLWLASPAVAAPPPQDDAAGCSDLRSVRDAIDHELVSILDLTAFGADGLALEHIRRVQGLLDQERRCLAGSPALEPREVERSLQRNRADRARVEDVVRILRISRSVSRR